MGSGAPDPDGAQPQPKYNSVHLALKSELRWQHFNDFPQNPLTSGGATTLGGEMAISGGGTPWDTGCGTPFRPVPDEFYHWSLQYGSKQHGSHINVV